MNLRDENGTVINADFSLAFTDGRPSIIVESSGGASQKSGRGRRNPDYNDLMSLLLRILARRRIAIESVALESAKVSDLPISERIVKTEFAYPMQPWQTDVEELRKAIGRAIAKMHQAPGVESSGNAQKRIALCLSAPIAGEDLVRFDEEDLAASHYVTGLTNTEKEYISKARIGQGRFREALLKRFNGRCPVTGIINSSLLVASHIKPWRSCSHAERLDPDNGILLALIPDKLFDIGQMTFSAAGEAKFSKSIPLSEAELYSIDSASRIAFTPGQEVYLAYHRRAIFGA
jgi:hypothetical protein